MKMPIEIDDNKSQHESELPWTTCGRIILTSKDRQSLLNVRKLKDNHVNAFHNIAKIQFPLIGGLHNTLLLHKTSLNLQDYNQSLQIIMFIPTERTGYCYK